MTRVQVRVSDQLTRQGNGLSEVIGEEICSWLSPFRQGGHPWLTPVLGSGSLPQPPESTPKDLAASFDVWSAASSVDCPSDSTLLDKDVLLGCSVFLANLAVDRLNLPQSAASPSAQSSKPMDDAVASLAVATYAATRWFRLVKELDQTPLSRWNEQSAELDAAGAGPYIVMRRADQLVKVVEWAIGRIDGAQCPPAVDAALPLARGTMTSLNNRSLKSSDLLLLTELCWLAALDFLAIPDAFAGWSDALVRLAVASEPDPFERLRPSPDELDDLTDFVVCSMSAVTSAATRRAGSVHSEVAALLRAQGATAAKHATENPGADRLPVPVAFVTSFDVELEVALLSGAGSASDGQHDAEVIAVFPAYLPLNDGQSGLPIWMSCKLVKEDLAGVKEDGVLAVPPDRVGFVAMVPGEKNPVVGDPTVPHVVHLAGAPLIKIRPESGQPKDEWIRLRARFENTEVGKFQSQYLEADWEPRHLVGCDETVNLQMAVAEAFAASTTGEKHPMPGPLPESLLIGSVAFRASGSATDSRVWAFLGVQFGDASVRFRLMAQLMGSRLRRSPVGAAPVGAGSSFYGSSAAPAGVISATPPLSGIAVNRRIGPDEVRLLTWYGLSVARDDVTKFAGLLSHYSDHLKAAEPNWPDVGKRCRLP